MIQEQAGADAAPVAVSLPAWYSPERFAEMLALAGMCPRAINDQLYRPRGHFESINQVAFPGVSFDEWKELEALPGIGIDSQAQNAQSTLNQHFRQVSKGHATNQLAKDREQAPAGGKKRNRKQGCDKSTAVWGGVDRARLRGARDRILPKLHCFFPAG